MNSTKLKINNLNAFIKSRTKPGNDGVKITNNFQGMHTLLSRLTKRA